MQWESEYSDKTHYLQRRSSINTNLTVRSIGDKWKVFARLEPAQSATSGACLDGSRTSSGENFIKRFLSPLPTVAINKLECLVKYLIA